MNRYVVVVSAALFLTSCSILTEPRGYSIPDRDYSVNPASLVSPRQLYACNRWVVPNPPKDKKIFVDIQFITRLGQPGDRVYPRHIDAVKRHGGEIVYEFHFPVARVWIDANRIPDLAGEDEVDSMFSVSNLSRYDWIVGVGYIKPYTYEEGAVRFAQLGGRVDYRYNSINALSGLIPDVAGAVLRQDKRVDYAESLAGSVCDG